MVKSLPTVQETRAGSLGQEDPLEKEMAAHSSILARTIPWTEEPGGLQSRGSHSWTRLSDWNTLYQEDEGVDPLVYKFPSIMPGKNCYNFLCPAPHLPPYSGFWLFANRIHSGSVGGARDL